MPVKNVSIPEAAKLLGCGRTTLWRAVRRTPGFSFRLSDTGRWCVPIENVAAIRAGQTIEQVAAAALRRRQKSAPPATNPPTSSEPSETSEN